MNFSFFLEIYSPTQNIQPILNVLISRLKDNFSNLGEIGGVHLYLPHEENNIVSEDRNPPKVVFEIMSQDIQQLRGCLSLILNEDSVLAGKGVTLKAELFEKQSFPVQGNCVSSDKQTPLSFSVRYYPPIRDIGSFVRYYVANHPSILAKLPNIRNIFCYYPKTWKDPWEIKNTNCFLGNEVVFDNMQDLVLANNSEVRQELRQDILNSPVKPGPSTHFAYHRIEVHKYLEGDFDETIWEKHLH